MGTPHHHATAKEKEGFADNLASARPVPLFAPQLDQQEILSPDVNFWLELEFSTGFLIFKN